MALWNRPSAARLLVLIALLMPACTSVPAPVQDVAAAEQAVQAAAAVDAGVLAPAEFEKARNKLEAAKSAFQAQDHVRARQLAEQAVVDAELAKVTAETTASERAAATIRAQIHALGSLSTQGVAAR